jgi:hypothetical protein
MTEFEEYLRGTFEINNGVENDVDTIVRIHAPELLKLAKKELTKDAIEGWVARDECGDIAIFSDKPHRDLGLGMWTPARHAFLFPRKDEYPDVTWNSEPQRVKVIIIKE